MKLIKTLSCRRTCLVVGFSLFLSASQFARATISVEASNSFNNITIAPSAGVIDYTSTVTMSAYGQAGAQSQYTAGAPSLASATDVPVPGGSATGLGFATLPSVGEGVATGFIPGTTAGFDTSEGQASASGIFEITDATGPVSVTLSALFSGGLDLSADAYGVYGRGQTVLTLSLNGTPDLFTNTLLTIGPNQMESADFSETLSDTVTLTANTPYYLYVQADAEAEVINGSTAAPDSMEGPVMTGCLAMSVLLLFFLRQRPWAKAANRLILALAAGTVAGLVLPAHALYIGSDRKDPCPTCGNPPNRLPGGTAGTSLAEGNSQQNYPVVNVRSSSGPTLPFRLIYNSYNADGSRAQLDTGLGFGWTHSFNPVLFQQRGQMFRLGEDGRVTQYYMNYSSPGSYTSDTGYFETLTMQSDGTYYITNKYQSWWHFGTVPNTPFLIEGPVYRLLQMGDRNQNTNTMSYTNGLLAAVTDTYGRTLQFTYNSGNHLSSVIDPLGRTMQFQYDSLNREMTQITDPLGNAVQYTYNSQYQITRKVDRDGRMYFYTYKSLLPFMVTDGSGQPYFSMSNPVNWAVNQTNLAFTLQRQYIPGTTTSTDGRGNAWQYTYDTNGYITQVTAPDSAITRYTYDAGTLQVASKTDADGHTTQYQYDAEGNRISMTDALGNVTTYTYDPIFNLMTSMTDPNDRTTTWQYDAHGNQILMTDALGQMQSWTYDTHGNVLTATDKRGYTTTNQYDGDGNVIETSDPLGDVTTSTYDAVGNRLSLTDANSHTTRFIYDLDDRLIQTTDPLGFTNTVTYDGTGDALTRTDANGHTTSYYYDLRARLVDTTNALGGVSQWTYDPDNNVITRTDENSHTTTNGYDTQNRLITTTDPLGNVSSATYDPVGNRITTTDANGHTSTNGYDALNRRVLMTDPLGNVTTYEYANIGGLPCCGATAGSDLITGIIDADSKITYYNYDELNRRTNVVFKSGSTNDAITPSDAVTTTTYDPDDNRIAITDPNNNTTTMGYDPLDRLIAMTNAAGDVSTTAYDPVGNVIQTVDPRGNVTTYVYDADNRKIQKSDSVGPVLGTGYDGVGNVISSTNGNGDVTTDLYDVLNRRISAADPLGHTTTTAYDPVGNVLSTTDRDGNTTRYTYDADNRRISMTDALGDTSTTAYDAVANVISMTDALGHTTTNFYDADNRPIRETYPDNPSDTRTYSYDATGHRISRVDQNGQTTTYQYNDFYYMTNRAYSAGPNDQFIYDLGGRRTNAIRNGWTNTFTYDGANRLLADAQNGRTVAYAYIIPSGIRIISYPGGTIVTETNDLRSRLVQVNDGGSPALTQYTYDLDNNVLIRTNRNGTTADYAYNPNDWITNLTHSNASALIAGFGYTYDNEGNKAYQMNLSVPSDSEGYSYDALYRLTNFDIGALSGGVILSPLTDESYNLDAVGNWTSFTSNAATQTRTHNAVNELLTINGSPLKYDDNGNLTNDGQYAYAYDVENRVTNVTRDSDSALVGQYAYDALGRRISAIVNPAPPSATNVFFYDGDRILEEQNAGGTTQATYTYGNYVDEVLTMVRGGQTYCYHPNALFSLEVLTDSTGTPVERYKYDAYGEPTVMDGSYNPLPPNAWGTPHSAVTNFYLFTGRELGEESGLYFYRSRYYDPFKGRFLQRDRVDYIDGLNLYEFLKSRPTRFLDAFGLYTLADARAKLAETAEGRALLKKAAESLTGSEADMAIFNAWMDLERNDMGWLKGLPNCPCSLKSCDGGGYVSPDDSKWELVRAPKQEHHPGAKYDLRSKESNEAGAGQQCTFDENGNLITEGIGAGTPDRKHWWPGWAGGYLGIAANWVRDGGHIGHDVTPFEFAAMIDARQGGGNRERYLEVRPPNNGNNCPRNRKP
jgi:RHS repeat-associated protein